MPLDETAQLAARLARIKAMIADLETACANNRDNHDKFVKLKAELEAARAALRTFQPPLERQDS